MTSNSLDLTKGFDEFDAKSQRFKRMRSLATLLLVVMTGVYIASSFAAPSHPWLSYIRAFAEAAMIGACADWFAVVALFRQPFGLPIPHTGIVPRNKDRIGEALGRFIAGNFLSAPVLTRRLQQFDPVGLGLRWINDQTNKRTIARYIRRMVPLAVASVPHEKLESLLPQMARSGIQALPAAPLASKILSILWAQGQTQALIDRAIDFAEATLIRNKGLISQKVSQKSSRLLPRWVDAKLADKVMEGLLSTFGEMRAPNHPWRIELRGAVEQLIFDLANDPAFHARGEAIKTELLSNQLFLDQIDKLCRDLESKIRLDATTQSDLISKSLINAITSMTTWVAEDPVIQARIETWVRNFAVRTVVTRRVAIGAFIAHVVSRWDSLTLVEKLERHIGADLQYIRINGTLVGGLVGLILFSVSHWAGAA
jgi:uncharacterized membrane-anchored protein YjiN (DUF445 family)